MKRLNFIFIGLFFTMLLACEKVIDISPGALPPKLVVDGTIESGQPPIIYLTRSLDYFNELTPAMLSGSFVRNAEVSLSDGLRTVLLKEYPVSIPAGVIYVYSIDTSSIANIMIGQFNKTYKLTIRSEGQLYESTTTIPALTKKIDSVWWEPAPNNPDTNRVVVFARVEDPPGKGNYIRYFTSRNDSAFLPGFNSVFDDGIVDGLTYNIQVFRGQDRNQDLDQDEFGYFRKGDTVDIKLTNIDKPTFDFWRTWEQNQANVGNPFGVPIKVLSNISNGAIGIWCGYAGQVERVVIPK